VHSAEIAGRDHLRIEKTSTGPSGRSAEHRRAVGPGVVRSRGTPRPPAADAHPDDRAAAFRQL